MVVAGHRRVRLPVGLALALMSLAACTEVSVRATSAKQSAVAFNRSKPLAAVDTLPDIDAAAWGSCDDRDAPWQCATISVPVDYRNATGSHIDVAITRLPATESRRRIGSLVLNPGGPGGSGIRMAWEYAASFPASLTSRFDIVGFDPRGIGRSSAIDCDGTGVRLRSVLSGCSPTSKALLPYAGTTNVARDLEMIRRALGDDQLTYLGFSYGTALGAVYADLFPTKVRAAVLDGSVDPTAGTYNVDGTVVGNFGDPFYGPQDFFKTEDYFFALCDSVRVCRAGPDSQSLYNSLHDSVGDLPTTSFKDHGAVTADELDSIVFTSMYSTDLWQPLSVALADASDGDASTLAGLSSFLEKGYPASTDSFDNMIAANAAVYCADFAGRHGKFAVARCSGVPDTAEPLPPITATSTDRPIVVIGTDGDPATPGELAPKMAAALGDAVSIRWEGAGHTAFLNSDCIDRLVVDYLVDLTVPKNRMRCRFTADGNTQVARANHVFEVDRPKLERRLADVLAQQGSKPAVARCIAKGLVADGSDSVIVYARLGVQRSEYTDLRKKLEKSCA